jgi:hypothetical protein
MRTARVPLTDVFRHEHTQARALGFQLQCRMADGSVGARMQPRSDRARQACDQASGQPGRAIESVSPVQDGQDTLDVLHATIRSAMQMAREVMA